MNKEKKREIDEIKRKGLVLDVAIAEPLAKDGQRLPKVP